jgi:hypothetical protein
MEHLTHQLYLTQDSCFPPAQRLWALKPDFHCGGRKKHEFALFLSRSALSLFFALFFLRAFALFFGFALASAKKAPPPTFAVVSRQKVGLFEIVFQLIRCNIDLIAIGERGISN